jgi:solute carrier family 25 (mitochondrial phosphate transporter), member 23/24/25/41
VLFKNIDKDGNGKLDKKELQSAFKSARLTVSSGRLTDFFNDMDMNNDGYISFDEWRQVYSLFLYYDCNGHPTLCASLVVDRSSRTVRP